MTMIIQIRGVKSNILRRSEPRRFLQKAFFLEAPSKAGYFASSDINYSLLVVIIIVLLLSCCVQFIQ